MHGRGEPSRDGGVQNIYLTVSVSSSQIGQLGRQQRGVYATVRRMNGVEVTGMKLITVAQS